LQRAEVEVEGWVWMVKYGASRGVPLSTTLLEEAAAEREQREQRERREHWKV
jgi:hypothetical protein